MSQAPPSVRHIVGVHVIGRISMKTHSIPVPQHDIRMARRMANGHPFGDDCEDCGLAPVKAGAVRYILVQSVHYVHAAMCLSYARLPRGNN